MPAPNDSISSCGSPVGTNKNPSAGFAYYTTTGLRRRLWLIQLAHPLTPWLLDLDHPGEARI